MFALGEATRYCGEDGVWSDPNVLSCRSREFVALLSLVRLVIATSSRIEAAYIMYS